MDGTCVPIVSVPPGTIEPPISPPPPPPPPPPPNNMDGGMVDAGDAGVGVDVGTGDMGAADLGPGMETMLPSSGLVWLGEYQNFTGQVFTAFGRFDDRSNAQYFSNRATFMGEQGEVCTLFADRLSSGAEMPVDASHINIEAGPSPHASLLYSRISAGRFEPLDNLTGSLFAFADQSSFTVFANAGAIMGQLADQTAQVPAPLALQAPTPAIGDVVDLNLAITVTWMQQTVGPMPAKLILALRDIMHLTTLRCELFGALGNFTIPMAAVDAWRSAGPVAPYFLEIANEGETTLMVPRNGGGSLPVTFRTSQGLRWSAQ